MFPETWTWITIVDTLSLGWLSLCVASALYVAWDQFKHNPEPAVMKWGFILVTLYMGPLGLLLYVLSDKEPSPGQHGAFIKPLWKQGVGSTIHCVAGDATGIIAAAIITNWLGLPMWVDLLVEYAAGFLFGWFIFQSLFMKKMMGGSYTANVRKSFLAEWISMNAMMAGMAPVMTFLMMGRDMRAMEPTEPLFWVTMSMGVTAGFLIAYPFNVWMVAKSMKHGLMTQSSHTKQHQNGHMDHEHAAHGDQKHSSERHHSENEQKDAHRVTSVQRYTMALFTTVMLGVGMLLPSVFLNTKLSARDVGGVIMPPGMKMDRTTSAASMKDMRAVLPAEASTKSSPSQEDKPLGFDLKKGVKEFHLTASVFRWNILKNQTVDAYGFNGQVPGPKLKVNEGDDVRIVVKNDLPEDTTVHWHGLILKNKMDGAGQITQKPIHPGKSYTYQFKAVQSGTYFYHSHTNPDRQQALGLYGTLIIDPKNKAKVPKHEKETILALQEWLVKDGLTYPAMPMDGAFPNFFTINGKAFPETKPISMKTGEKLLVRFVGSNNNFVHPMHIHGGPFQVVARDGEALPKRARYSADTVNVGPGQRYDVIWTARKPGKWLIHCHIPHHTTNNNKEMSGGGGLMKLIEVK